MFSKTGVPSYLSARETQLIKSTVHMFCNKDKATNMRHSIHVRIQQDKIY